MTIEIITLLDDDFVFWNKHPIYNELACMTLLVTIKYAKVSTVLFLGSNKDLHRNLNSFLQKILQGISMELSSKSS